MNYDLLPPPIFPIRKTIRAMTRTTIITPDQTPALKIFSITEQLLNDARSAKSISNRIRKTLISFMMLVFNVYN